MWHPPAAVPLPDTQAPIGHRRTHAIQSVELCSSHAGGQKQRTDFEAKVSKLLPKRSSSR